MGHEFAVKFSGFTMLIFVNQEEYVTSLTSGVGIRLLTHRQDQQPFPEDDGMDISPGLKASLKVSMVGTKEGMGT